MKRGQVLLLFVLCAMALLSVMAWLTSTIRRLDFEQRQAREQAALEESVRLALWRMESLLGPLLMQESARPYAFYRFTVPPGSAKTSAPSIDLRPSPFVRFHFEWDARDRLTLRFPDASPENQARHASASLQDKPNTMRLTDKRTSRAEILARLGNEWMQIERFQPSGAQRASEPPLSLPPSAVAVSSQSSEPDQTAAAMAPRRRQQEMAQQAMPQNDVALQATRNTQEWVARNYLSLSNSRSLVVDAPKVVSPKRMARVGQQSPSKEVRIGIMEPLWLDDDLFLVRRIRIGQDDLVQGCRLNWSALRSWLLDTTRDLLPEARLEPIRDGETDPARRLAALPVRLVPGQAATRPASASSTLRLPLAIAWASTILSLMAVGALLLGIVSLGERRAAFVSAVTHELRTPLTTFRMYSEMLAENMVADEKQKQEYLETLQREAERQSHLVENVLAYARLERGRYGATRETLALSDLLRSSIDTLERHAARCGMTLVQTVEPQCGAALVEADASAVERILFNLVDNACKYASAAHDRRIYLAGRVSDRHVMLTVSDHGPGLSRTLARRVFRPFRKSAREAANSAPGVGLGLALSRRLARAMGGDLRVVNSDAGGASFCLRLRRAGVVSRIS